MMYTSLSVMVDPMADRTASWGSECAQQRRDAEDDGSRVASGTFLGADTSCATTYSSPRHHADCILYVTRSLLFKRNEQSV